MSTSPAERTEHVLELAGSQVHFWVSGPVDAPLVALAHGALMDHRMFDSQVPALVAAGYRVLVWDMRGHGRSKPLGRTPVTVPDLADELLKVLEHVGVTTPVCLVGQSMGGYVTQELVYRHPDRVAAMSIIGATCITMPISRLEWWALRSSRWWLRIWPYGNLRRLVGGEIARRPEVQKYVADASQQVAKDEFVQVWRAVVGSIHPEPGYRIEQPLLLTHGEHDRSGNIARIAPRWAARDPRCRYEVISEASHNANQDNPDRFNTLLLEFLAEHYPVSGRPNDA